ncbi:MAG: hypothetical protein DRJ05_04470 [Bacteroidetes bacterium]|nr:MAG: hypothetical protein DRJ05_04470 [Bacteroidota bacterium]
MKHLTKYTIILLASLTSIFGFAQTGSSIYDNVGENFFTQSPSASDSLLQFSNSAMPPDTYWITDDVNTGSNYGGTVPTDIFYLEVPDGNDKIYVYGKRNIVVIDAVTKKTITTISNNNGGIISDYSQFYPAIEQTEYLNYNHFAYNPNSGVLYCVVENANIISIDTEEDTWDIFAEPIQICGESYYYNYFLRYDNRKDWVYLMISNEDLNELHIYNADNPIKKKYFNFNPAIGTANVRGFEISNSVNEFYYSQTNCFYRVAYSDNDEFGDIDFEFFTIASYGNLEKAGSFLYAKRENADDKLFCFPIDDANETVDYFIMNIDGENRPVETSQCPGKVTAACYDGNDNIYFSYVSNSNQDDLRRIDIDDYTIIDDVNTHDQDIDVLNNTLDLDILGDDVLGKKVLISKTSEITLYNPASRGVTQAKSGENHYFSRIAVAPDELTAYAINTWGAGIDAVDQNGDVVFYLNLGGIAYHACFNKHNGRIYFYNKHIQETGKVYIFNTANNSFATVEIDGPISDIEIDPVNHNALVSTFNNSHFLKVIQDDDLLDETSWIGLQHGYINEIYVSPEENLYCVAGKQYGTESTGIEIGKFDQSGNYNNKAFLEYNTSNQLIGHFAANTEDVPRAEGTFVYAAIDGETTGTQKMLMIDDDDPNFDVNVFAINEDVFDIVFNNGSSTVYMAHNDANNTVSIFDIKNGNEGLIETVNLQATIRDIESNSRNNFIYVLLGSMSPGSSDYINKLSGVIVSENPIEDLYGLSSSMKFNADNSMLYLHVPYIREECGFGSGGVYEIFDNNTGNPNILYFPNDNIVINRYLTNQTIVPANHDIVFDNEAHRLYYGGGGHSNIVANYMSSYYILLDGNPYTWLSVPRHERPGGSDLTPTSTVFAQENITGGYSFLHLTHNDVIPGPPHEQNLVYAEWTTDLGWQYDHPNSIMPNIHSTRGYKLEIQQDDPASAFLELQGDVQDPNTGIELYCNEENWIGYFLFEKQNVFDALGDALQHIYHIKHQDFTCYRYNYPVVQDCYTKSTNDEAPPIWVCDKSHNIEFGDMVIVKPSTSLTNFKWQQSSYPQSDYTRTEVVYYTYGEEADYSTFVVELDTTQENPEEIGAFVNDTCVGACSVNEGDSLVVLRAYLGEQAGDSVVFEEHYASKSTNNINVADYYVLNPKSGIKEKRVVKTGEGRDVFIVSFRKEQKDDTPDLNRIDFNIWPNPSSGNLFYSFILENDADVNISIFDIAGKIVGNPINEPMQAGSMNGEFSLSDFLGGKLKPGVYFVKLNAGDLLETKKVIVN